MGANERPGLREQLARAVNSSDLSPSYLRETDVDRIGALAFADALGAALLALKDAMDARAYPRALALLVRDSRAVCGDRAMRTKLCKLALDEWVFDLCDRCHGRGHLVATTVAPGRPCTFCGGSGKRQPSDARRANKLGLDVRAYRKWETRYNAVQNRIAAAESLARWQIASQLERRKVKA